MFITLPTITELENLQFVFTLVLLGAGALWLVKIVASSCADEIQDVWHLVRAVRRARRIRAGLEEHAERRLLQAVMARETR